MSALRRALGMYQWDKGPSLGMVSGEETVNNKQCIFETAACLEGDKNRGYKGKNRARQRSLEPWEQTGQGVGQTSVSKRGQGL